ncbi:uncharacterized protein IL334_003007 [Kwoniella shivajii]|uniref:Carrier domain-containing protein n=1 Tax=Kwoniella shivajii TaxID=564305 RepID=A0ABZ1CWA9_9TREE|nr:hypothetical protein IL334_003007 [Kwoniella shivajii]
MSISYLVSTAGHAQQQNELNPHDIKSIVQLVEDGAKEFGLEKVVGFTSHSAAEEKWECNLFSFDELLNHSGTLARGFVQWGVSFHEDDTRIVSLLCPTGIEFLISWIALMRMGYGVVFIAPQCSPTAITHLYHSSSSTKLIYHSKYTELAKSACDMDSSISDIQLPSSSQTSISSLRSKNPARDPNSISHVFHTSGTSGTPKPIPNTHLGSVSVLPRRALPSYLSTDSSPSTSSMPSAESAAFTTTPLFHGGVSDLLRAWMARSMIYFYPTSDTPITSKNVAEAVEACRRTPETPDITLSAVHLEERMHRFKVTSFLSVPYILSTLAEDLDGPGMNMLKRMDLVSTGGAPLDSRIGNMMVGQGVRLVSRLGSSECGFLLSSHRRYEVETDWEWLRNDSQYAHALVFEASSSGVSSDGQDFEMIVTREWSSKTKTNRDDGSYATGDLYQKHPTKADVWRYVGRGDDVIVLSNGEKATPGPIETILGSSPYLTAALVVGAKRSQLWGSSFPAPIVISLDMCLIVKDREKMLPKSSKGTVQRGLAYDVFGDEIYQLYNGDYEGSMEKRSLSEIARLIKGLIEDIASSKLKAAALHSTTDLFNWGVDSLLATRVRSALQKTLNTGNVVLPNNIVFERPSIELLSQYIFDLQEHNQVVDRSDADVHKQMEQLAETYGVFDVTKNGHETHRIMKQPGRTVLLTGGTGSLGAFLIDALSNIPTNAVRKIICLVRADDDATAKTRIDSTMLARSLDSSSKLEVYASDLAECKLGLSSDVYDYLAEEVDVVIHAAWPVHFASSLTSFEDSIKGTRNLLDIVAGTGRQPVKMYYCSSLASVLAQSSTSVKEQPSDDPATASAVGYSQSKWVTEKICRLANESLKLRNRIRVLRIGQLCGDTKTGHWNEKEGWPLMIRTAQTTGCLPVLSEAPSWLPVDLAAKSVIDIVMSDRQDTTFVYHVAHPSTIEWVDILRLLEASNLPFQRVSPETWLQKVEETSDNLQDNPSKGMLQMWKAAYGHGAEAVSQSVVDCTNALAASYTMQHLSPIDRAHVEKMINAWKRTGFLDCHAR